MELLGRQLRLGRGALYGLRLLLRLAASRPGERSIKNCPLLWLCQHWHFLPFYFAININFNLSHDGVVVCLFLARAIPLLFVGV